MSWTMSDVDSIAKTDATQTPPLITLVVAAFNQERFVREAVAAAFAQTWSPLEIILSDDHSRDNTWTIIQELAATYQGPHKVSTNRNPVNLGIGGHVNRIFELASGEWLVLAAGDDVSLPNRVEKIARLRMQHPGMTACFSDAEFFNEQGEGNSGSFAYFNQQTSVSFQKMVKGLGGYGAGATYAYDKRVLTEFAPLDRLTIAEDRVLPLRASILGDVLYVPEILVRYRKSSNSQSNVIAKDVLTDLDRPTPRANVFWKTLLDDINHGYAMGFIQKTQQESGLASIDQARTIIHSRCQSKRWNPFIRLQGIIGLVKALVAPKLAFSTRELWSWITLSLLGPLGPFVQKLHRSVYEARK